MRATPVAVALLIAALASPALGGALLAGASTTPPPAPTDLAYVVHPAPGLLGGSAGEPSLGVNWATGATLVMAGTRTLRVEFDDATTPPTATWSGVTPLTSQENVDPILFTNHRTGRTYAGGLDGMCSILSMSDDDGATWIPVGNSCVPTLDHPSISSGPWRAPVPPQATYPQATYYCAQAEAVTCAISYDGGLTFPLTTAVTCGTNPIGPTATPGLHGTVAVGDNGVAWIPFRRCGNDVGPLRWNLPTPIGVAVSTSNGQTWVSRPIPGSTSQGDSFDPDVATTPSGWAYVTWGEASHGGPFVALTKDNGSKWTTPVNIGLSAGVRNVAFVEAVAGDDERVSVSFIGSTDAGDGFAQSFTGVWHLFVATSTDAGATWTVKQVTQDPVQRGWICADGVGCPNGGTLGRNLLDFIDMQVDRDGRVLVAIADGCVGSCAGASGTPAQSKSALATVVRQVCGPSLFAAKGNVEGSGACPGGGADAADPTRLDGPLYFTGLFPVGNAEVFVSRVAGMMSGHPPTLPAPKVAEASPVGGTTSPNVHDASFHGPFAGHRVDGSATIRLWVLAENGGGGRLSVSLYDAGFANSVSAGSSLLNAQVPLPATPGLHEIVIPLGNLDVTLTRGLTVGVNVLGAADAQILYDATSTPSRLELG